MFTHFFCFAKMRYVVTVVRCNGFLLLDASQHDLAQSAFWTFAFRAATYISFLTVHRIRWMSVCSTVLLLLFLIRKARECLTTLAWAASFLYNAASAALLRNTSAARRLCKASGESLALYGTCFHATCFFTLTGPCGSLLRPSALQTTSRNSRSTSSCVRLSKPSDIESFSLMVGHTF